MQQWELPRSEVEGRSRLREGLEPDLRGFVELGRRRAGG